jgi:hypothetical protein
VARSGAESGGAGKCREAQGLGVAQYGIKALEALQGGIFNYLSLLVRVN